MRFMLLGYNKKVNTMSAVIDPRRSWALLETRLKTETNPRLIHNLNLVVEHMKAEATADFSRLMAAVTKIAGEMALMTSPTASSH